MRSNPPLDGTAMGTRAAENRPVIGSWEIAPDEALVLEVSPHTRPLLELLSPGTPWWGTIDYGSHQSSLNEACQATVDDDGILRTVIAHMRIWASAAWLVGHGRPQHVGPIILRCCVRTETAPVPTMRQVDDSPRTRQPEVPAAARRVTPAEQRDRRPWTLAGSQ